MEMMTEKQLSKVLGISRQTLRVWRSNGDGPVYFKFGRAIRYHVDEVQRYLRQVASEPGKQEWTLL